MGDRIEYACEHCGYRGRAREGTDIDQIQCPMCGEPVVPV
jgi:predicted RNA-binding Zn-ribbon protein involved in translation (DUF1610 family)